MLSAIITSVIILSISIESSTYTFRVQEAVSDQSLALLNLTTLVSGAYLDMTVKYLNFTDPQIKVAGVHISTYIQNKYDQVQ